MKTINLDLTNVKPESSSMFAKLPAGSYVVSLAHSEFKEGKSHGAAGLQIGYMIEVGEHRGKMVSDYINIANANQQAVEIGLGRLRAICDLQKRTSFKLAKDIDLISRAQFMIDVVVEESEYMGKKTENNKIKKLYPLVLGATPAPIQEPLVAEPSVPKAEKLPWD